MKLETKSFRVATILSLLLVTMLASCITMAGGTNEEVNDESHIFRTPSWWDARWHYRMFIEIDANDHERRSNRAVEYALGLDSFADLDPNSIRVIENGVEIPSQYDAGTDTLIIIIDDHMNSTTVKGYVVYYDTMANGAKPVPSYGDEWMEDYANAWEDTEADVDEYQQSWDEAYLEYLASHQITEVGGSYVLRGEEVVYDPGDARWEYLNGTAAEHYIIGDGTFYWYNGQSVYRDSSGWFYDNGSMIVGGIYFFNNTFFVYAPDFLDPTETILYAVYQVGDSWYLKWGTYVFIAIEPINNYYQLGNTIIYRNDVTGIWYYKNHSSIDGVFDYDGRYFRYLGYEVYQDPGTGDWYYVVDGTTVGFASKLTGTYYFMDQEVYYDTGDERWEYWNGTELVGYAFQDSGTGEWYVYIGEILEILDIIDGTLWYDDEFIVYDESLGTWTFLNGTEVEGEVDESAKVANYGDQVIYYDPGNATWYYENGGTVEACVYMDDSSGDDIYYACFDGILRYFYIDDNNILYFWNGTEYHVYGPYEYQSQSFVISSTYDCVSHDEVSLHALDIVDSSFGDLRSTGTAVVTLNIGESDSMDEYITATVYKGVPDYYFTFSTSHDDFISCWGSMLVNLNGTLDFGPVEFSKENITGYIEDIQSDLDTFGVNIDNDVESFINGTVQNDYIATIAERMVILTENDFINIGDIDFDTDGYVMADDSYSIYSTGHVYVPGEQLQVVPMLLSTRYIGIYDVLSRKGRGIASNESFPIGNYLVEAWKETLLDRVNYYINISCNYIDWWYTASPSDPLHDYCPGSFTLSMVYLDGNDTSPVTTLEDAARIIPDVIVTETGREPAIAVALGVIIAPAKVEVGTAFTVVVGIFGETLDTVTYKVDGGTEHPFSNLYPFDIMNAPIPHTGSRANTSITIGSTGQHTIVVIAYDTNGTPVQATTRVNVSERSWVVWTWVASLVAAILGALGIAVVQNRKVAARSRCIGGKCNIS